MGMDIYFGTMIGLRMEDIGKYSYEPETIIKYNENTGKPYITKKNVHKLTFNINFAKWKKGNSVLLHDFNDFCEKLSEKEGSLVFNDIYIGFKTIDCDGGCPQDMCIDYHENFEEERKVFKDVFGLDGNRLIYVRVSF